MYQISFENFNFYISLTYSSFIDKEEYQEDINYLKFHYLPFDKNINKWKISSDRIQEIILWFERDKKEYDISEECVSQFKLLQNQYQREVQFFRSRKFDKTILNEGIEAKKYQETYINWRLQRSSYIDAHDAGTGKTFGNICVFSHLYNQQIINGIIILVPIGLSYHWEQEILKFVHIFKKEDIQIIDNILKIQPFQKFRNKKILIIRHDLYADCIASYHKNYDPKKSLKHLKWKTTDYVNVKKEWDKENIFICVDEAHSFKHTSSIKTKALFSTKKYFDYRSCVSATPWINGIEDSYSSLSFIDHSIIPFEENVFRLWLGKSIGNRWDRYAINSYNVDNTQKLISNYQHVFTQIRKEDIDEIKTKTMSKDIKFQSTPQQLILYKKIVEQELSVLQEEYDTITWKLLLSKLHLMLEVFDNPILLKKRKYDDESIHSILNKWKIEYDPKFIYLKNRLEDLIEYQNKKVIIYDIHPDTIELLSDKFKQYKPLIIHGQLKVKDKELDRKEKENLFNYDKNHKLMILSAYTSSQGINLQYGGSNILFYTLPFDATLVKQGRERTDRVTSIQNSIIEYFYYPHSIDNLRYKKVINRLQLNSKMDQILSQSDLEQLLNGNI